MLRGYSPRSNLNSLVLVTAPSAEPVTTAEAKEWCKISGSSEDTMIDAIIKTARLAAEKYMRRVLISQTWALTLDRFPGGVSGINDLEGIVEIATTEVFGGLGAFVSLPLGLISSITSIKTYNLSNTETTLSSAAYTLDGAGSRIMLNDGYQWPTELRQIAAVKITYVAGFANAAAVPEDIKTGIKQHVYAMYEDRNKCEPPAMCLALYDQYRILDRLAING